MEDSTGGGPQEGSRARRLVVTQSTNLELGCHSKKGHYLLFFLLPGAAESRLEEPDGEAPPSLGDGDTDSGLSEPPPPPLPLLAEAAAASLFGLEPSRVSLWEEIADWSDLHISCLLREREVSNRGEGVGKGGGGRRRRVIRERTEKEKREKN